MLFFCFLSLPLFLVFMAAVAVSSDIPLPGGKPLSTVPKKSSDGSAIWQGYKLLCRKFSYSSAQDLRCLDMEKEKEDASSPRGVIEACMRGGDKESVSPESNTSESGTHSSNSLAPSRWRKFFNIWKKSPIKRLPSIAPMAVPKRSKRKSLSARENRDGGLCDFKSPWKNFTLSELQTATSNFSSEGIPTPWTIPMILQALDTLKRHAVNNPDTKNIIGKGGYAEVYKGSLANGQLVAIKRLNKGTSEEQTIDFLSELGTIAHVDHPNAAKLVGYGVEGGTYLVLELSPLGSLGSLLHGSEERLDWGARYKIILGTADGLLYLHENCQRRIIHRDIKAANILLTENFEAQICDFGLAKWLPKQWTHHNVSKFEGTFGYFAPEYFMHGIVDEKIDVYSFGVLVLEIVTGRQVIDDSQKSLVLWAKPLLESNAVKELVDPFLSDSYNLEEMDRVLLTASLCIDQTPLLRPRMSQVVELIRGDDYNPTCPRVCQKKLLQRTYSEELNDVEEYNSTKYLRDLNRHKQIALAT